MAELLTRSIDAQRSDIVVAALPQRIALRTWGALAILCLGAFLVVLDTTIVNIAIPSIMTGLHSSLDQVLWVLNAYTLVFAALLITGGRLGDLYGPSRLLIVGILVFGGASVACALAPSAGILIAARVLQGVGGALMTPQTLAMIPAIVPANRRGRAIGLWSGSAAPAGHRWDRFGEPWPAGAGLWFGRRAALCLGHDYWVDHHPCCDGCRRRLTGCFCCLGAASARAAPAASALRVAQFHRVRMGDPRHPDSDAGLHRSGGPVLPVRASDDGARRRNRASAHATHLHARGTAGGPAR